MNGSQKFIIHVGLHKTGSTSIQLTCLDNSELLVEHGYYYPRFGEDGWANHSVPLSLLFMDDPYNNNHTVKNVFKDPQIVSSRANEIRKAFEAEVYASSFRRQNILISGEDVSIFSENELRNLINFLSKYNYEVGGVIIYVRNPVRFALSNAQELVRAGVMPLGRALEAGNLQQARMKITKIANIFGESAIRVISFERAVADAGDISMHFLDHLGVSTHGVTGRHHANESSSLEKTLAISALCRVDGSLARLASGVVRNSGSRMVPSRTLEEFVFREAREDVVYLSECFGIDYSVSRDHVPQEFDRSVFLMNLHHVRKIANEKAGIDIEWSDFFRYVCEDTSRFFIDVYNMVLVMAYNCTQNACFKKSIDKAVKNGKLAGKYIHGVFQAVGDEINPDDFDEDSYLQKNPDLQCVGDRLFQHYYAFGRFAGRRF